MIDKNLPIFHSKREIEEMIKGSAFSIVIGETGSGKTTQLPLILNEILPKGSRIAITQPRRLAAVSVSEYVANSIGTKIGKDVGYQVRFDDCTNQGTYINFMTDGILLAKIRSDRTLAEYDAVMIDEAHERSLNIDFILGLTKEIQKNREEAGLAPLKILVTSATLEEEKFINFFQGAPVVTVPGRTYPVEINHYDKPVEDYAFEAARLADQIINSKQEGDILIFMPGQADIDATIEYFQDYNFKKTDIHPLYGQMDPRDQYRIFKKGPNRKIIVATNIAETSITVPGIRIVIDSGLIKEVNNNLETGIQTLAAEEHAQSGCIQRAGRAGRTAPGTCYRLYTEYNFKNRARFQTPEILRVDLAHVILLMKRIGIKNPLEFDFIDRPDEKTLQQTICQLITLGALGEGEEITDIGKFMSELPLEPHMGRMIIEAQKYGCVDQVCTIAAFLGLKPVFIKPKGQEDRAKKAHKIFMVKNSDFLTLLNVWKNYRRATKRGLWASRNFLNNKVLMEVDSIRNQLRQILKKHNIEWSHKGSDGDLTKALIKGFADKVMRRNVGRSYGRIMDEPDGIKIYPHPFSNLKKVDYFVASEIFNTGRTYARNCHEINTDLIVKYAPQLITTRTLSTAYDYRLDRIVETKALLLKGFDEIISHETTPIAGPFATEVFAYFLVEHPPKIKVIQDNQEVIKEATKLAQRSGQYEIYHPSPTSIAMIYKSKLGRISSLGSFKKFDQHKFAFNLEDFIPKSDQIKIFNENPDTIEWQGREYNVQYTEHATIETDKKEIMAAKDYPHLPSGRQLRLKITDEIGNAYIPPVSLSFQDLQKRLNP